eukprot:TRINITY_DN2724_c1_g1_i1.p1 TRINITY_DN2724_c1_g1~~TRINITY_DN2724_c1_g1_i1.p1  ORF type:complete len:383 (+),score=75.53 TRINITY_DN2724_c1_g1_i1:31-1149(+)
MEVAATENVLERVRQSAAFVREHAVDVHINSPAITAFVEGLDMETFRKKAEVTRFPLSFASVTEEANFWGLLDLLNFGSGFRHLLHLAHQQGAYDTIVRGVVSMYISGSRLDAAYLTRVSVMDIESNFGFPLHADRALHEGLTYISEPTQLMPLGKHILKALNETGQILLSHNCPEGLGQWIMRQVTPQSGGEPVTAAEFVAKLVATFPAFRDKSQYEGREVYVLKKAQLLAADLYRLLSDKEPKFKFTDIGSLTVFSDNVLPAVLRKYGILELSASLAEHIDAKKDLPAGRQEIELRCVAIAACQDIIDALNNNNNKTHTTDSSPSSTSSASSSSSEPLSQMMLDYFLWAQGKADGFRTVERHYTKDTYYY